MDNLKFRQFIDGEFWYWGYGVNTGDPATSFATPKRPDLPSDQWSGLLDKNGIKIYSGDIIDTDIAEARLAKVYYQQEVCTFALESLPSNKFQMDGFLDATAQRDMKIIGNIHENPELLK